MSNEHSEYFDIHCPKCGAYKYTVLRATLLPADFEYYAKSFVCSACQPVTLAPERPAKLSELPVPVLVVKIEELERKLAAASQNIYELTHPATGELPVVRAALSNNVEVLEKLFREIVKLEQPIHDTNDAVVLAAS